MTSFTYALALNFDSNVSEIGKLTIRKNIDLHYDTNETLRAGYGSSSAWIAYWVSGSLCLSGHGKTNYEKR